MKYPKKYLLYWIVGIAVSLVGVIITKKGLLGESGSYLGSFLALAGLTIIAFGVSRKSKDVELIEKYENENSNK